MKTCDQSGPTQIRKSSGCGKCTVPYFRINSNEERFEIIFAKCNFEQIVYGRGDMRGTIKPAANVTTEDEILSKIGWR